MDRLQLTKKIIQKEWLQFTSVNNQGGRASCQDDRETFDIMRKSQFMAWNDQLLESYLHDLEQAENKEWSLLAEKYARMMVSTAPEEYEQIKEQRRQVVEATKEDLVSLAPLFAEVLSQNNFCVIGNSNKIEANQELFKEVKDLTK